MKPISKARIDALMRGSLAFGRFFYQRLHQDRLSMMAGSLAYVSLLSLVPLFTVAAAILSAFPMANLRGNLEHFVLNNFVPSSSFAIKDQLQTFVGNASQMTAVGLGALVVVTLLLIAAIDKSLNSIWRVHKARSWRRVLPIYWTVLTLGPLLVGTSLGLSSYLLTSEFITDSLGSGVGAWLLARVPLLLSVVLFCLLYLLVPNQKVRFSHGLSGAIFAALLFELGKRGFALYIAWFPSYQLIYGALAAVPILFVWVYLSWMMVLLGAELTAALGEFNSLDKRHTHSA